jgi:CspA family cold shock protein
MPREMQTGHIDRWDRERGFGLIANDAGGVHIFVHATQLPNGLDELPPGQRVRFVAHLNPERRRHEARRITLV